ncbi:MAG: hypothetical protein ACH34X_11230 [Thiolinea sp.]
MNKAIQQAIDLVGSQRELARVSGVRQSTISVLLNGRNGKIFMPRHSTARRFEAATNGRIKWHQFFEEEQGATQENPNGTEATAAGSGDTVTPTNMEGRAAAESSASEPAQY